MAKPKLRQPGVRLLDHAIVDGSTTDGAAEVLVTVGKAFLGIDG